MRSFVTTLCFAATVVVCDPAFASTPSAGAMLRLLESDRVQDDRTAAILMRVIQRGDAEDLGRVMSTLATIDLATGEKAAILSELVDAAKTRKVVPKGDLSALGGFVSSDNAVIREAALPLVGLWEVDSAIDDLKKLVTTASASAAERQAALDALSKLDRAAAREVIDAMVANDQSTATKLDGIARLAAIDTRAAAAAAATMLASLDESTDPAKLLQPFLQEQTGPRALARELSKSSLSEDQAKRLLSRLSSLGSSDGELTGAILRAGNLSADGREWSKEQIAAAAARVEAEGDPGHGEEIFRREALNCFKCHQINKAGGNIGPELSAVGVTSPADYLVRSLIYPSADIKEAWATRLVQTAEGKVLSGIVVSEDDELLRLKDAQGMVIEIPVDDIDAEKEGDSLMPAGLTKFLTDAEFIDLVAYLKALGQPASPYAVRQTPRLQRYEYLKATSYGLESSTPGGNKLEKLHQRKEWTPFYAKTNGEIPFAELTAAVGSPVIYLRGSVDAGQSVAATLDLAGGRDGLVLFFNGKLLETTGQPAVSLDPGRNRLTLRIDTRERRADSIAVTFVPSGGGSIQPVDGQ